MAVESPYSGLYYCEKCHKTKPEKDFYSSKNLEKYPNGGKLKICKQCISMHVDNWNPDTYTWILEECDVPYIPQEWGKLMQKYAKDSSKLTGATILGRYLAKMHMKQYRDYRWSDNEFLQELANSKIEATMKMSGGYSASDIATAIAESQKIDYPERPQEEIFPVTEFIPSFEEEESFTDELTDEDRIRLRIKWGKTYKPEEWIQLEQLYEDMMRSYDIHSAGHIDTLKLICKTSLKANQLLDLGDVDGAQKMTKMYDMLMKSGKFTEAQNKAERGDAIDSVSELVAICEKEGFIPRYYVDEPKDKVDRVLQDLQLYTRTLVTEEMGLGNMIEKAVRQMEEDRLKKMEQSDDDDEEDTFEDELFEEEKITEPNASDLLELMELEEADELHDLNILERENYQWH